MKPKMYKMRITTAPIQPAKNIKLKTDKSKYNVILITRPKVHDMQPHANSQMAFNPILLSVKFGAYRRNKIRISIVCTTKKLVFVHFFKSIFIKISIHSKVHYFLSVDTQKILLYCFRFHKKLIYILSRYLQFLIFTNINFIFHM